MGTEEPGRRARPPGPPARLAAARLLALRRVADHRLELVLGTDEGVAHASVAVAPAAHVALAPLCELARSGVCCRAASVLLATYLAVLPEPGPPLLVVEPGAEPAFRLNLDGPAGPAAIDVVPVDAAAMLVGRVVPVAVDIG